ncbi:MAG: hypothetical protein ACKPKO_42105, partial [Candidatus Fonsibacter sp.]
MFDPLATVARDKVFELLVEVVNPQYYMSVNPRGFRTESFVREVRDEYEPTQLTRAPRFDGGGKVCLVEISTA